MSNNSRDLGYSAGAHRAAQDIMGFGSDPNAGALRQAVASSLNSVFSGNSGTVVANLTGIDHTRGLPSTAAAAGANASANVEAAVSTEVNLDRVDTQIGNFQQAVEAMQAPLHDALDQVIEASSMSPDSINNAFRPGPGTEAIDVGANMATAKIGVTPGVVKAVSAVATVNDAVGDARAIAGSLSADQEAEIADQVRALLTPEVDPVTGEEIAPAAIPSNLNTDYLAGLELTELVDVLKQALRPPEDQPEYAVMMARREELSQDASVHASMEDENAMVLAVAEEVGVDAAEITAAEAVDIQDAQILVRVALTDPEGFKGMRSAGVGPDTSVVVDMLKRNAGITDGSDETFDIEEKLRQQAQLNVSQPAGIMG